MLSVEVAGRRGEEEAITSAVKVDRVGNHYKVEVTVYRAPPASLGGTSMFEAELSFLPAGGTD